ncbi:MAG: UDP-N-acetylmuramoyl-tripeptide--D-alanyl-D-alanine ligase [Verrucomicrobiota bacterium]
MKGARKTPVRRVCTDSRTAQAGDLFFALPGERFDGHNFLTEVAKLGATAVVIERNRKPAILPACAVVVVDNTRQALGRLGAAYRKDFSLPMVAVGGSNGKTTTKELIAAVLRQKLATLWSEASFNNDIGVPLTLLRLEKSHEVAVFEVGTNHPGELAPLVQMVQPTLGVITNIGREHLEFFGDVVGVADEEGMLAELLPAGGNLFVNGDDEWTEHIVRRTQAGVVRVGMNPAMRDNDWRARTVRPDTKGVTFRVDASDAEFNGEYRINLLGRHQVVSALFAIAVGKELGLGREEIQHGLAECQPSKMRLQFYEASGMRVLDDAYNANADSMAAALATLKDLPCKGRRVALLGDMAELGAHSEAAHAEVGRRAAESGVGQLLAVGKMASVMAQGARDAGLNRVMEFADVEAAAAALKTFLKTGDVVLLKASRATHLERVAEVLRAGENGKKH